MSETCRPNSEGAMGQVNKKRWIYSTNVDGMPTARRGATPVWEGKSLVRIQSDSETGAGLYGAHPADQRELVSPSEDIVKNNPVTSQ